MINLPANNFDLEQVVLGTMFIGRAACDKLFRFCRPQYFYATKHIEIFKKAQTLHESGKDIDLLTLTMAFSEDEAIRVDAPMYIAELGNKAYTDAMLSQHITGLMELYHERLLKSQAGDYESLKSAMEVIERDRSTSMGSIVVPADLIESSVMDYYDKGVDPGIKIGFGNLDRLYRIVKGEYTIVTGTPNSGKSEFIDAILVNLAKYEKWKFAIMSPENYPVHTHVKKLIEKYTLFPFFEGFHQRLSRQDARLATDWVNEHFRFLHAPIEQRTLDYVLLQLSKTCRGEKLDGVVIDPWNELEHHRPIGVTEHEYIGKSLSHLKSFTQSHDVHTWMVAHPTKLLKDKEGKYPVAKPYDISGSANWYNKPDMILSIYLPYSKNDSGIWQTGSSVQVYVQKVRNRDHGKRGMAEFRWDGVAGTYTPVDEDNIF